MHEISQTQPVARACRRDENHPWQWLRRLAISLVHAVANAILDFFFVKIILTAPLP